MLNLNQRLLCPFFFAAECDAVSELATRIESLIEQMPGHHIAKRLQHRLLDTRMLDFQIHDEPLDPLTLEAEVAAGGAATADDWQADFLAVHPRLVFTDIRKRANHDVFAVVGHEPRGHRLQGAGEEQVQQEGLDEVVQVMTQCDLRGAHLGGDSVQDTAPQSRAERTGSRAGLEDVIDEIFSGERGLVALDEGGARCSRRGGAAAGIASTLESRRHYCELV